MSDNLVNTGDTSIGVVDIQRIFLTLWRRKVTVIGTGMITGLAAVVFALSLPNQYQAAARIILEPEQTQLTGFGAAGNINPISEAMIESNAYMVQSNRILEQVVSDLELDTNEVFLGPADETEVAQSLPELDQRLAMKKLNEVLTVRPVGKSFIVSIEVRTESPQLSADIANAVATTFIASEQDNKSDERQAANIWLLGRLEDLRSRVNQSSRRLETFRSQAGDLSDRKFSEVSRALQALRRDQQENLSQSEPANSGSLDARIEGRDAELRELTSKKIELDELERQAEADSVLYERLLERARELQELETFQASNIRVVSDALPPLEKSAPRRTLIVLLGGILGCAIGAGFVVLRETP